MKNVCFPEENTVFTFLNWISLYCCEIIITQFRVFKKIYGWSWKKEKHWIWNTLLSHKEAGSQNVVENSFSWEENSASSDNWDIKGWSVGR